MIASQVKEIFQNIPRDIKIFLLKALVLFIAWNLIFHLYLAPRRVPDKLLTDFTCYTTAKILSTYYKEVTVILDGTKPIIAFSGNRVIGISDTCNALEIYVLYIGFLFCFPSKLKKRWIFLAIGLPIIFIMNIIRCVSITIIDLYHSSWVDISHHYIFTTLVYLAIFYLWVLFSKTEQKK